MDYRLIWLLMLSEIKWINQLLLLFLFPLMIQEEYKLIRSLIRSYSRIINFHFLTIESEI